MTYSAFCIPTDDCKVGLVIFFESFASEREAHVFLAELMERYEHYNIAPTSDALH